MIEESEANVVRYVFDQYAKGVHAREIVEELAARRITFRGKPFNVHRLYWMLQNEKYSGVYITTKSKKI
ncbi:MAG: recombinase family protein [Clostridia bacterium]|nr:recombinase family protein [Clostridia bacterium]